jgi:hypothetical protein
VDAVAAEHAALAALPPDVAAPVDAAVPDVGQAQGALQAVPAAAALSPDAVPVTVALPAVAVAVAPPDAAALEQRDALQAVPAVADAVPVAASRCSVPDALPGAVVPPADVAVAPPDGSPAGQQFQAARQFPDARDFAERFLAVPAQAFPDEPRAAAAPFLVDSPEGAPQIQGSQRRALAVEPRVRGTESPMGGSVLPPADARGSRCRTANGPGPPDAHAVSVPSMAADDAHVQPEVQMP